MGRHIRQHRRCAKGRLADRHLAVTLVQKSEPVLFRRFMLPRVIFLAVCAIAVGTALVWLKPWGPKFGCWGISDPATQDKIFTAITPFFETKGRTLSEEIQTHRDLNDFEYRACYSGYLFSFVESQSALAQAAQNDTYIYVHDFDVHLMLDSRLYLTHVWFGKDHTFTWAQFIED
jgi:hypothetical protein